MKKFMIRPAVHVDIWHGKSEVDQRPDCAKMIKPVLLVDYRVEVLDDLVKDSPCFFASERLVQGLRSSELSGVFRYEKVKVVFHDDYLGDVAAPFYQVDFSENESCDFFVKKLKLIVSEKGLVFLKKFRITSNISEVEV